MPVLEAMAAGVPVITSSSSSLPEVAGEAALLVEPRDVTAISAALQKLVDDGDLRAKLAEAGHTRAAGFTWERAVAATWEVYEELL